MTEGGAEQGGRGGLERELKLLVDGPEAFRALARLLGLPLGTPAVQVNRFLDTAAGDLRRARHALRVRDEEGSWTLTAKGPPSDAAGGADAERALAQRPELELELSPAEAADVLSGRLSPLALLAARAPGSPLAARIAELAGGAPLGVIGGFTNRRARLAPVRFGTGPELVLELDRTELPGGRVDHEVELELDGPGDEAVSGLRALFRRAGLAWRPAPSKARRFFEALAARAGAEGAP